MMRWMGVMGVVCIVLAGFGCGDEENMDTSRTAGIYDQLSARETAYHASVNTFSNPEAIRTETADYAQDMHDMLDSMQEACSEMMHGSAMMDGHTMDEMMPVMDRMRSGIDDHASRMAGMGDMEAMRAACDEHHALMGEMLQDMDAVLHDVMPCCGGH